MLPIAKRKKGSKTVPKGKAPLGELPLPYEGFGSLPAPYVRFVARLEVGAVHIRVVDM